MKLLLDACVLYPTVMREMLLGAAQAGFFVPVWSDRLLEEWARAAARRGPLDEAQARGEIALLRAAWPKACHPAVPESRAARLWLPDPDDIHVLASAIDSAADGIVTLNARDFPRGLLAEEGLLRADPDGLLVRFFDEKSPALRAVADQVLAQANKMDSAEWTLRALMKKARLPRLGKALDRAP